MTDTIFDVEYWVKTYNSMFPPGECPGLFRYESGQPVLNSALSNRIKAVARHAGIDPSWLSGHSPRIGLAQEVANINPTPRQLCAQLGWKCEKTALIYIEQQRENQTSVPKNAFDHALRNTAPSYFRC